LHPNLLKIDVEGGGAAVLSGAKRVIEEDQPIVLFAIHNEAERQALMGLKEKGYRLESLEGDIATTSEAAAYPL
jgi:hypothetical protein